MTDWRENCSPEVLRRIFEGFEPVTVCAGGNLLVSGIMIAYGVHPQDSPIEDHGFGVYSYRGSEPADLSFRIRQILPAVGPTGTAAAGPRSDWRPLTRSTGLEILSTTRPSKRQTKAELLEQLEGLGLVLEQNEQEIARLCRERDQARNDLAQARMHAADVDGQNKAYNRRYLEQQREIEALRARLALICVAGEPGPAAQAEQALQAPGCYLEFEA